MNFFPRYRVPQADVGVVTAVQVTDLRPAYNILPGYAAGIMSVTTAGTEVSQRVPIQGILGYQPYDPVGFTALINNGAV